MSCAERGSAPRRMCATRTTQRPPAMRSCGLLSMCGRRNLADHDAKNRPMLRKGAERGQQAESRRFMSTPEFKTYSITSSARASTVGDRTARPRTRCRHLHHARQETRARDARPNPRRADDEARHHADARDQPPPEVSSNDDQIEVWLAVRSAGRPAWRPASCGRRSRRRTRAEKQVRCVRPEADKVADRRPDRLEEADVRVVGSHVGGRFGREQRRHDPDQHQGRHTQIGALPADMVGEVKRTCTGREITDPPADLCP